MNIIIVGAGTVGFSLAEHFSGLNHHINVIEQNNSLCENIKNKLDVFVINGAGSSPAALEQAGIKSADMIIAVTPNDEANLLICNFAKHNGVQKRIARVKSDLYTTNKSCINLDELGVTHVIEPEREVMKKILQYIELPGVLETANFQSDSIYLRGYQITKDMPVANKTLAEIHVMAKHFPLLFVVITREGKSLSPTGDQKLLPGDKFVAIMPRDSYETFLLLIKYKTSRRKKVIVSGDSLTAIHLAKALKPLCEQVFLVDPNYEHGRMAASMLNGVEVLHGDSTNSDVLQEIQVKHADCFIAAGEDTEDNIMSCLMAKSEGTNTVIAIRNSDRYSELFHSLGIDHIINPKQVTLNSIIEKIQLMPLGTHLSLETADIEINRLKIKKNTPVTGKSLQQLDDLFKKSIIIGCIIRNNSIIIPDGHTTIETDDEIMILCQKKYTTLINKWFNSRFELNLKSIVRRNQ